MELSKILSISGKAGLFKILAQSKGGVVVESLLDGKRMAIGQTQRVSTLSDISVYTVDGDMPLGDIFDKLQAHSEGKSLDIDQSDNDALRSLLAQVVPDYDADRVYVSDIRKMVKWFNILVEKDFFTQTANDTVADADIEVSAEEVEPETTAQAEVEPAEDSEDKEA